MSIAAKRPNELIEILKADFISRAESIKIHDHSDDTQGGHDLHALAEVELNDATELTIAGGIVTRTQVYHRIDTELDAGSDDLDTVNGGATGDLLVIRAENSARTVVVKHNVGNIWLIGLADISLTDAEDHLFLIYDGAKWCSAGDGGGGGGAHNLLSATHGDTAVGAVVDGDVIIGNVTPAWSRLAISIPAANVRNVLGIDNGELRPAWKTALDAVAPTTMAAGDAAAAGTSLVFAHRDHRHGSPATWPPADHDHSAPGSGGQLDWDAIWSDAVHDHSAAGEGGQLDWDNVWADAVHDHSSAAEGGAFIDLNGAADALVLDADGDTSISAPTDDQIDIEVANADQVHISDGVIWPDANNDVDLGDQNHEFKDGFFDGTVNADAVDLDGNADALILDADGDTTISAPTDDQVDCEIGGSDLAFLTSGGWSTNAFAFVAKNTSGAAAAAGDVGYIDSAGEYKTTTTAYLADAWCVVVKGGNDNTDIYVARRGRVTVTLNGNCSIGDYLYTSTTAGQAQPQAYVRPEVFAVALTANAGGAGGTCSALLLCHTETRTLTPSYDIYNVGSAATSQFTSTIASLPGGAPTTLTYGAVTTGAENTIVPASTSHIAKLRLYNSTRGTYCLVSDVNVGTNTITFTTNVTAGWQVGDTITSESQTVTHTTAWNDLEFVAGQLPVLTRHIYILQGGVDTGGIGSFLTHPWETGALAKQMNTPNQVANGTAGATRIMALQQGRIAVKWISTGAATGTAFYRLQGVTVAVP